MSKRNALPLILTALLALLAVPALAGNINTNPEDYYWLDGNYAFDRYQSNDVSVNSEDDYFDDTYASEPGVWYADAGTTMVNSEGYNFVDTSLEPRNEVAAHSRMPRR